MATVEEALRAKLLADGTVAGLVGTRVYPLVVPAGAQWPALAYQRISGPRLYSQDGDSRLAWLRVQFSCLAATYAAAKAVAAAVRGALSGFKGTVSGVVIGGCFVENEVDHYEEAEAEAASGFMVALDVVVWATD